MNRNNYSKFEIVKCAILVIPVIIIAAAVYYYLFNSFKRLDKDAWRFVLGGAVVIFCSFCPFLIAKAACRPPDLINVIRREKFISGWRTFGLIGVFLGLVISIYFKLNPIFIIVIGLIIAQAGGIFNILRK